MSTPLLSTILDAILVTLLLISCVTDWRERIIPHWLNITIALLAPISWWNHGFHLWPDVAWQLGLSISVTAFFLIFQAIGMMGGGDVKLLGALASALRVLSAEFRHDRMMRAEEKAARLPALMSTPLILFILPTLFIVVIGPASCSIAKQFGG